MKKFVVSSILLISFVAVNAFSQTPVKSGTHMGVKAEKNMPVKVMAAKSEKIAKDDKTAKVERKVRKVRKIKPVTK